MNSTNPQHLQQLQQDFRNPEKLICVEGTMRDPQGALDLVETVMEKTGGRLNHVIAHSGVRWWANPKKSDSSVKGTSLDDNFDMPTSSEEIEQEARHFRSNIVQEPTRHFLAAKLLLPKLRETPDSTYIFVTGGAGDRSITSQVNAHAVWGLAKSLRQLPENASVRMVELRSNLHHANMQDKLGPQEVTEIFTRSADLGEICAGMVACKFGIRGLHHLDTFEDVDLFRSRFPCPNSVQGLPELFTSNELPPAKSYS
jgi:hypothetical protein